MKQIIFLLIRYRIENPDEPRVPCNKQLFEPAPTGKTGPFPIHSN